ncbi:MAG: TetR/AcrR family transcriptional regulator [Propionibacteriaceae bacterium]|nr:TetR/AcrR family transcriptional regulator [Propionibacteriaceae bacterium]
MERIVGAFWTMLGELPYDELKITALARRARVSPNTLYYHFDGMADIASAALEQAIDPRFAQQILLGGADEFPFGEAEREKFSRIALFAQSGSARLVEMLSELLRGFWLDYLGLTDSDLNEGQARDLRFALGGALAVLGDRSLSRDPAAIAEFFTRPLGAGVAATLRALERHGRSTLSEDSK